MVEIWMTEVKHRFPNDPKKAISHEDTSAAANTSSYMDNNEAFPDLEQELENMQQENYFHGNFNIENPFGDIDIHGEEVPEESTTAEVPTLTEAGQQLHAHYSEQLQGADNGTGESQTHKSNTKNYYDEEYRNITTSYPSLQYDENETQAGGILRAAERLHSAPNTKNQIYRHRRRRHRDTVQRHMVGATRKVLQTIEMDLNVPRSRQKRSSILMHNDFSGDDNRLRRHDRR